MRYLKLYVQQIQNSRNPNKLVWKVKVYELETSELEKSEIINSRSLIQRNQKITDSRCLNWKSQLYCLPKSGLEKSLKLIREIQKPFIREIKKNWFEMWKKPILEVYISTQYNSNSRIMDLVKFQINTRYFFWEIFKDKVQQTLSNLLQCTHNNPTMKFEEKFKKTG